MGLRQFHEFCKLTCNIFENDTHPDKFMFLRFLRFYDFAIFKCTVQQDQPDKDCGLLKIVYNRNFSNIFQPVKLIFVVNDKCQMTNNKLHIFFIQVFIYTIYITNTYNIYVCMYV